MKKTLLVSGCSVTHGAELYNKFMHPNNIKFSFSQLLADKLGCNLTNVALSAASNEYIFHSLVDNINSIDNIHSIIVVWTGPDRLYWKTNNRHYFFLGNFASSMIDPVDFEMHDLQKNNCWFTGDNDQIVDQISKMHSFFVTDYFDHQKDVKKCLNYKHALSAICQTKNIQSISLDWNNIDVGTWLTAGRHPDKVEHQQIADLIYKNFYYENIHLQRMG